VHGHIVRNLELSALVEGLSRPAMAGEAVQVDVGTEIPVVLSFDVPPFDYQEQPNHVDTVEFVVITPETIESRAHHVTGTRSQSVTERVRIGSGGAVVRARVRRDMPDGTALMAYTNAVRIYSR
jgi:hypothetical protein